MVLSWHPINICLNGKMKGKERLLATALVGLDNCKCHLQRLLSEFQRVNLATCLYPKIHACINVNTQCYKDSILWQSIFSFYSVEMKVTT